MDDISQLTIVTLSAASASVLLGKTIRFSFQRLLGGSSEFIQKFSEATTSAFVLTVCTFEKMLPLLAGSELIYYIMTFLFGIAFSKVFVDFSPSPCTPLHLYWKELKKATLYGKNRVRLSYFVGIPRSIALYLHKSIPSFLGLFVGYQIAVAWLNLLWNGFMTSHHSNNLTILNSCVECLNMGTFMGFLMELVITVFFLESFNFIDTIFEENEKNLVQNKRSTIGDSIKSLIAVIVLYLCTDKTGAFANPFLAYVIQRNCLTDIKSLANHIIVYALAPMIGTIIHLIIHDSIRRVEKEN